jgi:two-component sensor histidine kinase
MNRRVAIILIFISVLFCSNLYAQSNTKERIQNIESILALWNGNGDQYEMYPVAIWEKRFEKAYEQALKLKNDSLLFKTRLALSYIYHDQAKFTKAIPLLKQIYQQKSKLNEEDYKTVLIKLEEEYRSFEDIRNALLIRNERIKNGYIITYWEIYRDCGLFEAAKKDYIQFQKKGYPNSRQEINYYLYLGDLYFELNQIDSAKIIYTQGMKITKSTIEFNKKTKAYRETDLLYFYGSFLGNIAKCDIAQFKYKNAIPSLLKDISYSYENLGNKVRKMYYLSNCYLFKNNPEKAKLFLDSGISIFSDKTNHDIYLLQLKTKANYYKYLKLFDSAYLYETTYSNYKDSIDTKKQENQSFLLLAQLELTNRRAELVKSTRALEEKNKIIQLQKLQLYSLVAIILFAAAFIIGLFRNFRQKNKNEKFIEQQNQQLTISSNRIKNQNDKNEILLKELHHRVKNNLQVMYSLLNLQKRRNKDEDTKNSLLSIQNRIQTMALVHQNLYTTGNFEMVEVSNYIKTLVNHLLSIYKIETKEIELFFEIEEDLELPIEYVVSIGLIINEAVSNALKYAFNASSKGKLYISVYSKSENCFIIIKDNGPGFDNKDIKENSLGMKLIKVMCAQLKAEYIIEKEIGVTHKIEFKK